MECCAELCSLPSTTLFLTHGRLLGPSAQAAYPRLLPHTFTSPLHPSQHIPHTPSRGQGHVEKEPQTPSWSGHCLVTWPLITASPAPGRCSLPAWSPIRNFGKLLWGSKSGGWPSLWQLIKTPYMALGPNNCPLLPDSHCSCVHLLVPAGLIFVQGRVMRQMFHLAQHLRITVLWFVLLQPQTGASAYNTGHSAQPTILQIIAQIEPGQPEVFRRA